MGLSSYLPPKPSALVPGYALDRYELLCPIAEGGMAAVWLARQRGKHGFQKLVAVKTILPKLVSEPDFREAFLDEARLASRIDHANVAQVLDLGEENGVLYLVIEWVDGDSLHKLAKTVSKKSLVLPQAILLRVLSDVCAGLHAAHELRDDAGKHLGVVHRDVSPQNILVSAHGTTKVIDFGIAKARDRLTRETTVGVVKGKLEYMSPEQAIGLEVDLRADIWAIGATFYRIVTGAPPFDASSVMGAMDLIKAGKLPTPLSTIPGIHPAVCKVIERALAPRAAARYATAAELHDALEAAMIEAGEHATTTEVQTFLATHLGERMTARKEAVRIALEEAVHRGPLASVVSDVVASREKPSSQTGTTKREGPPRPRPPAPTPTHTSTTRRADVANVPRPRRRALLPIVLALGLGSILGTAALVRSRDGAASIATAATVAGFTAASTSPPPIAFTVQRVEPAALPLPASASTHKQVGAPTDNAHARLPSRPTRDQDGILILVPKAPSTNAGS